MNESNINSTSTITEKSEIKKNLNETIQIYLRLRPCRNGSLSHPHIEIASNEKDISIRVPIEEKGYMNNTIMELYLLMDKLVLVKHIL